MAEFEGKMNLNVETSEIEVNGKFKLTNDEPDKVSSSTCLRAGSNYLLIRYLRCKGSDGYENACRYHGIPALDLQCSSAGIGQFRSKTKIRLAIMHGVATEFVAMRDSGRERNRYERIAPFAWGIPAVGNRIHS